MRTRGKTYAQAQLPVVPATRMSGPTEAPQPTPGPTGTHCRWGTETCNAKLDLLRVMGGPGAATAVDASVLGPQRADDQGAIRLQPVPE